MHFLSDGSSVSAHSACLSVGRAEKQQYAAAEMFVIIFFFLGVIVAAETKFQSLPRDELGSIEQNGVNRGFKSAAALRKEKKEVAYNEV